MTKVNAEIRVRAFELFTQLKSQGLSRIKIIQKVKEIYDIPYQTIYAWYTGKTSPFGKKRLHYRKELFYVLGALLGDGYLYAWKAKPGYRIAGVIGEKEFIEKYAKKLSVCLGRPVKGYVNRSKNVWFLNAQNIELYYLFEEVRKNREMVRELLQRGNHEENALQFIEGYFDAEGCVKIIKEKVRKTPKICLDLCSTDHITLEMIRELLEEQLGIKARYSVQKPFIGKDGSPRKTCYHLRIYKKEFVKKFFENIDTTKLKPEKVASVAAWTSATG